MSEGNGITVVVVKSGADWVLGSNTHNRKKRIHVTCISFCYKTYEPTFACCLYHHACYYSSISTYCAKLKHRDCCIPPMLDVLFAWLGKYSDDCKRAKHCAVIRFTIPKDPERAAIRASCELSPDTHERFIYIYPRRMTKTQALEKDIQWKPISPQRDYMLDGWCVESLSLVHHFGECRSISQLHEIESVVIATVQVLLAKHSAIDTRLFTDLKAEKFQSGTWGFIDNILPQIQIQALSH